jgi:MEMO1 family protein
VGTEEAPGTARVGVIRHPIAAGTFYPRVPDELQRTVDGLLAGASSVRDGHTPKALVAPHAGYAYSGPVAASAYALLRGCEHVRRIALLGPAHFAPVHGLAVPNAAAWRTSLGDVEVDRELRDLAIGRGATADDRPHEPEHALEVQLPFLIRTLDTGITILPVAVASTHAAVELIGHLADRVDLVVVSTDLSHDRDDRTAKLLDRRTADAVLAREPDAIGDGAACGVLALRALVTIARHRSLAVRLLDLRTSADTAGSPERVVGYGAFAIG